MQRGDEVGAVEVEDFELSDETGTPRRLSGLLQDGPVVLFFYPIASSGGCTQEACHFRDLAAEFAAIGAQPVGISGDAVDKQRVFATAHSLGYPLLSDPGHAVAKQLGAYRWFLPGGLHTRRMTFVIGPDRRVLGTVASESRFDLHADQALAILRGGGSDRAGGDGGSADGSGADEGGADRGGVT